MLPEVVALGIPPEREAIHPNLRVQDRDLYFREYPDRLGVGGYGHVPLPIDRGRPASSERGARHAVGPRVHAGHVRRDVVVGDRARAGPALRRRPASSSGINGIFSFTPDGIPLMGESTDVAGFWLAEAVWVTHGLGVGRAMAEWLVDGGSTWDLHECDVNRFEAHKLAPSFIHDRGIQNYVEVYDIIHPLQPMEEPRPLRTSPFYEREQELGAYFLEGGGWERPHWYGVNEAPARAATTVPGRERLGGPLLAPDRRRRGARDPRRRRAVRHDVAQAARGRRAGCPRLPRPA